MYIWDVCTTPINEGIGVKPHTNSMTHNSNNNW